MEPADLSFEDIIVGQHASFERTFTEADVRLFAQLSGDENPLHLDKAYAARTRFKKPLVHGMLVGSLCSALVGMYLPGRRCLYLRQTLSFKHPIFIGETLLVTGTVTKKITSTRMLSLAISITCGDVQAVEGEAVVQVLLDA